MVVGKLDRMLALAGTPRQQFAFSTRRRMPVHKRWEHIRAIHDRDHLRQFG